MSLLTGFLNNFERVPERIALCDDSRTLSYSDLDNLVKKAAFGLQQQQISAYDRVVIALDRGIDAAIAIYGVLHRGGCYVPLDLKNPANRLSGILEDVKPKAIIGSGRRPLWCNEALNWLDLPTLLGSVREDMDPYPAALEDLAAILYTSGSSGKPKGITLSHRAMCSFADWAGNTFAIEPNDRMASLAPFFFDLSVFDLFTSLRFGAGVYFLPDKLCQAPSQLSAWLSRHRITTWYTVPSVLSFLAWKGNLSVTPLQCLRQILFAGEVFATKRLMTLSEQLPQVSFYNLYGPTETNVCCYWPVERDRLNPDYTIPIGIPAGNAQFKICGPNDELWVKSDTLLSGYCINGQLSNALNEEGWYATGDRVALNATGELLYRGRLDRMLKCSGYRVEPAEIEAGIRNIPGVLDCAIIGINDKTKGQRPAAALVLDSNAELRQVNRVIRQTLPAYMQPTRLAVVESMPCLSNGKVDYQTIELNLKNH